MWEGREGREAGEGARKGGREVDMKGREGGGREGEGEGSEGGS